MEKMSGTNIEGPPKVPKIDSSEHDDVLRLLDLPDDIKDFNDPGGLLEPSQNSFHPPLDLDSLGNSTSTPPLGNSTLVGTPGNMGLGGGVPPHVTTGQNSLVGSNATPPPNAVISTSGDLTPTLPSISSSPVHSSPASLSSSIPATPSMHNMGGHQMYQNPNHVPNVTLNPSMAGPHPGMMNPQVPYHQNLYNPNMNVVRQNMGVPRYPGVNPHAHLATSPHPMNSNHGEFTVVRPQIQPNSGIYQQPVNTVNFSNVTGSVAPVPQAPMSKALSGVKQPPQQQQQQTHPLGQQVGQIPQPGQPGQTGQPNAPPGPGMMNPQLLQHVPVCANLKKQKEERRQRETAGENNLARRRINQMRTISSSPTNEDGSGSGGGGLGKPAPSPATPRTNVSSGKAINSPNPRIPGERISSNQKPISTNTIPPSPASVNANPATPFNVQSPYTPANKSEMPMYMYAPQGGGVPSHLNSNRMISPQNQLMQHQYYSQPPYAGRVMPPGVQPSTNMVPPPQYHMRIRAQPLGYAQPMMNPNAAMARHIGGMRTANVSSEQQLMAERVKVLIEKEGRIDLCILKGLLLGGPGVGKTTTIHRMLGKLLNLSECSPLPSTGIEKPQVVHLCHRLYHDSAEMSLMIEKEWKSLSLEDQLGALLYLSEMAKIPLETLPELSSSQAFEEPSNKSPLDRQGMFTEIEEMIKHSEWREAHQMLKGITQTTIMHITDTGGQPEFFEILPLLLCGPSLTLIFLNLAQSLSEPFEVVYRHSEPSAPLVKYDSSYTPRDMVHQILASIESLNQSAQRSAAFLIGTHRDQVNEEMVEAFEQEIKASLKNTSFFKNDLLREFVVSFEKQKLVFAVDNKNGKTEDINILRKVLTDTIHYLFKPESLPTSWAFFHLLLRHTFENDGVCSLREAVKLAGRCGVYEEKEVRNVLFYFYIRFGTIFYFGEVPALENLVICDPNLIFHPITRLIAESFGSNPFEPHTAEEIRKTGEISLSFFEKICQMDKKTGKIDTRKIVALLKHLHVITEIHNGNIRLFMSCLLRCYPTAKLGIGKGQLSAMNPAPLLFTFSTGYQPIGLFHVLLSRLLCKKFFLHEERFRNRVVLFYEGVKVEIISAPSNLEIRMKKGMMCKEVLDLLDGEIRAIIKEMPHMRNIECYISFPCPLSLQHSSESVHLAKLVMSSSKAFLCCSECVEPMELEGRHKIWFENDQAEKMSQSALEVNNSERNANSTVRVEEILQQNFSDLLEAVPNPVKLANDLWTAQMISLTVKNDVLSNRWMSDYEKASKLLNEATKLLKAFSKNPDHQMKDFKALCQVFQRQGDPVLSSLVDSMLEASGQVR